MGGALVASLMETVRRVMHTGRERFTTLVQVDENVLQEMHAGLEAEEAICRRDRFAFQEHMQQSGKRRASRRN